MKKSLKIHIPSRTLKTDSGLYQVSLHYYNTKFSLTFPNGKKMIEFITEFEGRSELYKQLEEGKVYCLIKDILNELLEAEIKSGIVHSRFSADEVIYNLKIHKGTSHVELERPRDYRLFAIENLYTDNLDIPLLTNINLDDRIRTQLEKCGLKLPKEPNRGGIGIKKNVNY